jgi:hypothetical protein
MANDEKIPPSILISKVHLEPAYPVNLRSAEFLRSLEGADSMLLPGLTERGLEIATEVECRTRQGPAGKH